ASFLISTSDKLCSNRKFLSCQTHGVTSGLLINPFDLVKNAPRLHDSHPIFGSAFAFAHTSFSRFFGHWLIGEHTNPDFSTTFDVARHRDTSGFDLAIRYPSWL